MNKMSRKKIFSALILSACLLLPSFSFADVNTGADVQFDINPKSLPSPTQTKVDITFRVTVYEPQLNSYCGADTFYWGIFEDVTGSDLQVKTGSYQVNRSTNGNKSTYNLDLLNFSLPVKATVPTRKFYVQLKCGVSVLSSNITDTENSEISISQGGAVGTVYACPVSGKYSCSASGKKDCSDVTGCGGSSQCVSIDPAQCNQNVVVTGPTQKYSCKNNACTVDPNGTMDSTCNYQCAPATDNQSYQYVIDNPLAGGPQTPFDIINIATKWLLNLSIPIAVMFILYAGYLLLTAGPDPGKVKQARGIITNVVLALAIIFIGRGFITLIYSIIELGGPTTTTATCVSNVCSPTSASPGQACKADSDCVAGKGLGGRCTNNNSCKSGLICGANNLCQTQAGNVVGDPCLSGGNCKLGLVCDLNQTQQVDGQTVGSCANR